MNKLGTVNFSIESSEKEIIKNSSDYPEYCDVCFIALGSHEKRIHRGKKVTHPDCVKKIKSK